jgi:hypothetical protein
LGVTLLQKFGMPFRITLIDPHASTAGDADLRVSQYDWTMLSEDLSGYGCAVMEKLLSPEECQQIAELYPEEGHFRSHIRCSDDAGEIHGRTSFAISARLRSTPQA